MTSVVTPKTLDRNALTASYLVSALASDQPARFVQFLRSMQVEIKWMSPHFSSLWPKIGSLSLLDPFRADMLLAQLEHSLHKDGDIVEFGVYRGGTGLLCALLLQHLGIDKTVHLFDGFMGLPNPDPAVDTRYLAGNMKADEVTLRTAIKLLKLDKYCIVHPGWFEDTIPSIAQHQQYCFAHIDCDLYGPASLCLRAAFGRLSLGGAIIIDDYYDASGGVQRAVDEFVAESSATLYVGPAPQVVLIKSPSPFPNEKEHLSLTLLQQHETYIAYLSALLTTLTRASADISTLISLVRSPEDFVYVEDKHSLEHDRLRILLSR